MEGIIILIGLIILYWLIPIILLILGFARIKSKPENAKKLLILAAILILVGGGICGLLLT